MSSAPTGLTSKNKSTEHQLRPVSDIAPIVRERTHVRLVLPAFNEELALPKLLKRIVTTMEESPWGYDVVVVDDGSSDNTGGVALELADSLPLEVVVHEQNRGLGAAMSTCLNAGISGLHDDDIVVAMDADNTHPPQLISRMVPMIREGYDIVIASRFQPGGRVIGLAWHRSLMSFGARIVMQGLLRVPGCRDYTCGFRAYRVGLLREAIRDLNGVLFQEEGFACMADLLLTLSRRDAVIGEVPLLLRYDYKEGQSKMQVFKTARRTMRMVLRHRLAKLRA